MTSADIGEEKRDGVEWLRACSISEDSDENGGWRSYYGAWVMQ